MALTTTYLSGAVSATPSGVLAAVGVNAYSSPSTGGIGPQVLGRFATGEYVLITGAVGTALQVVRGYLGSAVKAHSQYEGFQYGLASDTAWPSEAAPNAIVAPVTITNAQEVTLTGTTGTEAAVVTIPWPGVLNCSGTSGAGVNLPYPYPGAEYVVRNTSSGTLKVYSVGAQLNGTTGTTATSITTTGTGGDIFWCATAGTWLAVPGSI